MPWRAGVEGGQPADRAQLAVPAPFDAPRLEGPAQPQRPGRLPKIGLAAKRLPEQPQHTLFGRQTVQGFPGRGIEPLEKPAVERLAPQRLPQQGKQRLFGFGIFHR